MSESGLALITWYNSGRTEVLSYDVLMIVMAVILELRCGRKSSGGSLDQREEVAESRESVRERNVETIVWL